MKRQPFATVAQRAAWKLDCERLAARRMARRLMRKAQEPVPPGTAQLAQQYRVLLKTHREQLRLERERRVRDEFVVVVAANGQAEVVRT
jgi:hypothetical protein